MYEQYGNTTLKPLKKTVRMMSSNHDGVNFRGGFTYYTTYVRMGSWLASIALLMICLVSKAGEEKELPHAK